MFSKSEELWKKLVQEGLIYCEDTNCRLPFSAMSKQYGKAWIDYVKAAWEVKDEMSETEFCLVNGGVPASYVEKNLR